MTAHSVFIFTYLFYFVAVVVAVVLCKKYKAQASSINLARGQFSHAVFSKLDLIGILILVSFYALPLFSPPNTEIIELTPEILAVAMMTQIFPCAIAFFFLFMRGIHLSQFFKFETNKAYLFFLLTPLGVVLTFVFSWSLQLYGYEQWILEVFGEDAVEQQIVKSYQNTNDLIIRIMIAVMVVIIAPIVEEVVFRGYIYPVTHRFTGRFFAAIMTSVLFGIVHFNIAALLPLVFLALILTIAYEFTKSIWTPICIHALFNASTVFFMEYQRFIAN
ncbi:MAG: CPBP family intramembrane glutamic endopeptidase [Akkermansiaceae bacterium]